MIPFLVQAVDGFFNVQNNNVDVVNNEADQIQDIFLQEAAEIIERMQQIPIINANILALGIIEEPLANVANLNLVPIVPIVNNLVQRSLWSTRLNDTFV